MLEQNEDEEFYQVANKTSGKRTKKQKKKNRRTKPYRKDDMAMY